MGSPSFFLYLFQNLGDVIDRVVIGIFINQEILATYHIASRITNVFGLGIVNLTIAFFPIIMKLESLNVVKSDIIFRSMFKAVLLSIIAIFPFIIMFPDFIIIFIASEKYMAGITLLSIIAFARVFSLLSGLNLQFKGAKGAPKIMLNYVIIYLFSQIPAYLVFYQYGAIGIAFSKVLASIISFSYLMFFESWVREIQKLFLGKVIFLFSFVFVGLWILGHFFHVIVALIIVIILIFFVSSLIKFFTHEELGIIEKGIPTKMKFILILYNKIRKTVSKNISFED